MPMPRESIGPDPIVSTVLPDLQLTVYDLFIEKRA
jgi:hypothetical protein